MYEGAALMEPNKSNEARFKRLRLALSVFIIFFGLLMMMSTLTSYGPSPLIGIVFGGGLVFYGTLRAYQALRS